VGAGESVAIAICWQVQRQQSTRLRIEDEQDTVKEPQGAWVEVLQKLAPVWEVGQDFVVGGMIERALQEALHRKRGLRTQPGAYVPRSKTPSDSMAGASI
jgi:hypothetical protein